MTRTATPTIPAWLRDRAPAFGVPLALAVLWEVATRTELLDPRFFVPLTEIAATIWDLGATGVLAEQVGATLRRLLTAFAIAAVGGTILGIASGGGDRSPCSSGRSWTRSIPRRRSPCSLC